MKIYYLSSEIAPFSQTYSNAQFSKQLTSVLQERELDIRLIQPKYGYISERKYILREVIRLRDMPIHFDGDERIGSVKSAFIPNTKVQVYFMEDEQFFKPLHNLLYKARNGRILKDNPERYAYFARVALETLKHLFWKPDVIICNDWQMSFIPALYQLQYANDEFYQDIKTVFMVHSLNENYEFSRDAYDAIEMFDSDDPRLPSPNGMLDNLKLACDFADRVVTVQSPESKLAEEMKAEKGLTATLKGAKNLTELVIPEDSPEAWSKAGDDLDAILRNL